jgi:translation initiation factor IF-2
MNNAKVRIYELSTELKLTNKDILDICEQLNIAVKTHSSTITDSEADRIKSLAEKYASGQTTKASNLPKPQKKQQILAIHHKVPSVIPIINPTLTKPNAPGTSSLGKPTPKPQSPTTATESDRKTETSPSPISVTTTPPTPAASTTPVTPTISEGDRPTEPRTKERTVEKPHQILHSPSRTKESSRSDSPEGSPVVRTAPTPTLAGRPSPRIVNADGATSSPARPTIVKPPLKEKLGLNRPQPPQPARPPRGSKAATTDLAIDDDDDAIEVLTSEVIPGSDLDAPPGLKPKLKRPSAPLKTAKRGKWEQEEEEEAENAAKAAKAAGKTKRRPNLLLEEEDEDLDKPLESLVDAKMVSLSIARPAKPKSMIQPTGAGAGAPISNRPKKPQPKSEGGSSRSKADRRDRKEVVERPESITLQGDLTIRDLADLLKVPETEIVKNLFFKGIAINITQTLDLNTARLVAEELGVVVETAEAIAAATKHTEMIDVADLDNLQRRPPVVTIMGHVDHGKTTLLDSIRKTKVAQGEAGGITQHIGAYHVDVEHNGAFQQIVFLDTPGHEAFTAMRARGARVTDIAILVVAADDGVQPQTREAVSHARAAGVPIVVAINKVDKADANPDRIKQELAELSLVSEEWGGDVIMVPVSALKGDNLDTLLEMVLLVSEIEELSANPNRAAKGTVIEANLDRARGPVATLLVQNGTLRVGDIIVAGSVFGKIRAMIDDRGAKVEAATPSFAVEILGLSDVPAAGDEFDVFSNEKDARQLAESRSDAQRNSRLQQALSSRRVSLTTLSAQAQEGELKELNLIIKADVQGSLEAIIGAVQQLPQKEVQIRILLSAPGEVTETDVDLAAASGAVIVGFNTTLATGARASADQEGVDIREYDIIYKLLDDIQGAMEGLLDPEEIESPLGKAEVRAVFPVGRGSVAGCYVQSGKVIRNRYLRVLRNGNVIYSGNVDSLKRIKEDVREVNAGFECGIRLDKFNDWQEGDSIEAYEMTMKRRTLSK